MRHYFLTAREVTRLTHVLEPALLRAALGPPALAPATDAALAAAGFVLADGKLLPDAQPRLRATSRCRCCASCRSRATAICELHPLAMRALIRNERRAVQLRGDPEAAALFLDLLCGRDDASGTAPDGARWLAILNETGFLGRFLPDWARIVGQMQFDTYHVFTVDEHTIEAIRVLNALERGELAEIAPVASGLVDQLQSRRALYLAMLLHDIAKGRGGDHSELGAELALEVGPALGPVGRGDRDGLLAGAASSAAEPDRVQARHRRSEDHPRPGRHHPVAGAAAPAAGADGRRHARGVAARCGTAGRRRCCANSMRASPRCWTAALSTTERDVRVQRAKQAAAALLAGLAGGGHRALPRARLSRLLAVVRSGDACAPRPPDPRRRGARRAADGGYRSRCRRAR